LLRSLALVNLLVKNGVDVAVAFNLKPRRELNNVWSAHVQAYMVRVRAAATPIRQRNAFTLKRNLIRPRSGSAVVVSRLDRDRVPMQVPGRAAPAGSG